MNTFNFPITISLWRGLLDKKPNTILLNEHSIKYGEEQISYNDVKAIKYGRVEHLVNGRLIGTDYDIQLLQKNDSELKIKFTKPHGKNIGQSNLGEENHENYLFLIDVLWDRVCERLFKLVLEELNSKRKVSLANATISEEGFEYEYIPLFFKKKKRLITWNNILKSNNNGFIKIYDKNIGDKSGYFGISGDKTWNGVILQSLVEYLFQDGRCFKLAEKKII
jgi:hypothetical protein